MKKNGFTLIEMLIVLMIISVLLLITIPNVTKHNKAINSKGCEAYVTMAQAQVQAYQMENDGVIPTIEQLEQEGYIPSNQCPNNGGALEIDGEGNVTVSESGTTES